MNQTFVKASDGHLPWNASPVREYARVGQYIGDSLSAELRQFLPFNISCFADHAVADHDVRSFLDAVPTELEQELRRRIRRADALARVSGSPSADVLHFLTGRRDRQPWVLLYSRQGGLPLSHEEKLGSGVVPCSSMQNHGVAWRVDGHGSTQTWLATSPGENAPWNFDSDIGHESAHAAFAHVPLFAQGVQVAADAARFANLPDAAVMTPGHFAKLCYFFVEVAVVALRGEQRDTESGLPVVTAEELIALLRLSEQLMPHCGFELALKSALSRKGQYDVADDTDVFLLLKPMLAVVDRLSCLIDNFEPPNFRWFRNLATSLQT